MQIHWAARRGDQHALDRHLRGGVPIDATDEQGQTPLICAAESRRAGVATLRFLIDAGADANAVSTHLQSTPLMMAASGGNLAKVRFLLDAGANARFANRHRYTAITNVPVHRGSGHLEVLDRLLEAGADPNLISEYGECALRIAISRGNFPAVQVLLRHGASRQPAGFTELMWVIAVGGIEDVDRELRRGADLAARDYWEMTPWLLSLLTGDVDKARLLLGAGAQLDDRGRCGKTNLMYAVSCNHEAMTRWLVAHDADAAATDDFGGTPLIEAAELGATECVKVLLASGMPPDYETASTGRTAMSSAANSQVVRVLVAAGADINTVVGDGYHLLKSAAEAGDVEFVRELLKMGAEVDTTSTGETALHTAVRWDQLEIVRLLLAAGADPNASDVDMYTPLMQAQSLECVELLLAAGASVDFADQIGKEVVHHHTDPEILDRLRDAGATFNPAQPSSTTALHGAAESGDLKLVQHLVQQGADVNVATQWGLTPLMSAAEHGRADVMRLLLSAGTAIEAADENGRTALFYAAAPEGFTAFRLMQESAVLDWSELTDDLDSSIAEMMRESLENLKSSGVEPVSPDYGYEPSDDVAAIEILVQSEANLEARDEEGLTPLLLAARCGRPSRVTALLRLGADVHARDDEGKSAVDQVASHHDPDQAAKILRILSMLK